MAGKIPKDLQEEIQQTQGRGMAQSLETQAVQTCSFYCYKQKAF